MSRWLAALVLTMGLANTASAQGSDANLRMFRDVSDVVQGYAFFTVFDSVNVAVDEGVVTLIGKVTMPYKSKDLVSRVRRVDGVTAVRNRLEVLPVSLLDDRIRLAAVRAIYRHPSLQQYGLGVNPSIHVIVEHGRLTLDGVVNSELDRQIAGAAVGTLSTFGVTNNLKTEAEVDRDLERL
ncbi:MAG: BON domain-containing protein [Vicinamibacterales bacterium]